MLPDLQFQWLPAQHVDRAYELEKQSYPDDEAASLQAFWDRQKIEPSLFLAVYTNGPKAENLIGYVCATRSSADTLTHESMSHHETNGSSICIHSVCVDAPYRRLGVASKLLEEYASRLSKDSTARQVLLIAHEELVNLYEKAGFEYRGKSPIVHGSRPWFELRRSLSLEAGTSILPTAFQEAILLRPQPIPKVAYSQLENTRFETGKTRNTRDILCPRPSCGSVILKKDVGIFHSRTAVIDLNPLNAQHDLLPLLPAPPSEVHWWLITPSPMEFENISFSRSTSQPKDSPGEKPVKYLACADCDIGPLGWCFENSPEFWLVASRLAYKQIDN